MLFTCCTYLTICNMYLLNTKTKKKIVNVLIISLPSFPFHLSTNYTVKWLIYGLKNFKYKIINFSFLFFRYTYEFVNKYFWKILEDLLPSLRNMHTFNESDHLICQHLTSSSRSCDFKKNIIASKKEKYLKILLV